MPEPSIATKTILLGTSTEATTAGRDATSPGWGGVRDTLQALLALAVAAGIQAGTAYVQTQTGVPIAIDSQAAGAVTAAAVIGVMTLARKRLADRVRWASGKP